MDYEYEKIKVNNSEKYLKQIDIIENFSRNKDIYDERWENNII